MNSFVKINLALLAVAVLFRLGYHRAANQTLGSANAKARYLAVPPQLATISPASSISRNSRLLINSVPAEVDLYTSEEPLEAQTAKFENDWKSRGYKTSAQSIGNLKILSAINENTRQFECAMMVPDPSSRRTFVIPAQLDLRRSPQQGSFKMPAYPNAQTFLHLESQDLTGDSENLIQLSDAGVPAVMTYYKSQLLQDGWRMAETPKLMYDPQYADQAVFERGQAERWVYASKMEGRAQTMIFTVHNER